MGRAAAVGPRLAAFVHVTDDKGVSRAFGPDDEVPAWAQRKITNPKAWDGGELPKVRAAKPKDDDPAPAPAAAGDDEPEPEPEQVEEETDTVETPGEDDVEAPDGAGSGDEQTPPESEKPEIPPRAGPGSGKPAWHAYAKAVGLDVADDTSRDDVIELLEDAGLLEDEQA